MVKIFELRLDDSPDGGYQVILKITCNRELLIEQTGTLSSASESIEIYEKWQKIYRDLDLLAGLDRQSNSRTLKPIEISNIPTFEEACEQCEKLSEKLDREFSEWLSPTKSRDFLDINNILWKELNKEEEILFFISTECQKLRKLPWHSYNLFQEFKVEPSFSPTNFIKQPQNTNSGNKVRILAILGNSDGIDINKDRQELEKLSQQVEIKFLKEPKFAEFNKDLRDESESWDILFFAGHSETRGEKGLIYLNPTEKFSLNDFKPALEKAVNKGLQLAIFNSCDGLGLAKELEQLNIPATIVMREPIPDRVAQTFLKEFLKKFSQGNSLYKSVKETRLALTDHEPEYPGVSWLPIICQHHSVAPITWKKLLIKSQLQLKKSIPISLGSSFVILGLVIVFRFLGGLQTWELKAFDLLLRSRPPEPIDDRVLVVEVPQTELNKYGDPLPDDTLATLMEKLEQQQPRIIGFNIWRDRPVYPGTSRLKNYFSENRDRSDSVVHRVVGMCSNKITGDADKPGFSPPSYLPTKQIGFSDMVKDIDGVVRRHLVSMKPVDDDPCGIKISFSYLIAREYLAREGIKPEAISDRQFKIGTKVLTKLDTNTGGYYQLDNGGFQLLLNYRRSTFHTVTLSEILEGRVDPDLIRDKIIIIGITAPNTGAPSFPTPYSLQTKDVLIQAQMVSQLISAVKDDRPLLWVLPLWLEILWIGFWALIGGIINIFFHQRLKILIPGNIVAIILLSLSAFFVLCISGGWLPLLPPILALLLTTTTSTFVLRSDKISAIFRNLSKK